MKKIAIGAVYLFSYLTVVAQDENSTLNLNSPFEVVLQNESSTQSLNGQFSSIHVIDARDDSSEIGFFHRDKGFYYGSYVDKDWYKPYCILPTAEQGITIWITNFLQTGKMDSSTNTLLIVIKKFWISSEAVLPVFINDKKGQPNQGFDAGVIARLEFYLKRGEQFYPLYRFDSVIAYTEKLPQNAGYFATETLKKSLEKLFKVNWANIPLKKIRLSFAEIELSNKKNAGLPIQADHVLKKGVYKNFEEFKMNSPSISEYELRKGKEGDLLYVKENGIEYPDRLAWGFCDSKDIFVNSSDKYSRLTKRQNTFYFAGIKGISIKQKLKNPTLSVLNSFIMKTPPYISTYTWKGRTVKYYTVDMETGDVY
jgi:hypothetical protein